MAKKKDEMLQYYDKRNKAMDKAGEETVTIPMRSLLQLCRLAGYVCVFEKQGVIAMVRKDQVQAFKKKARLEE